MILLSVLAAATLLGAPGDACHGIQGRAVTLGTELGKSVPAAVRDEFVKAANADIAKGTSAANAWKRGSAGAQLARRPDIAAWAASRAVEISGDGTTFFAASLLHAGRLDDVAPFVACGKKREPKSAVPLEIEARVAWLKKDDKRAKELLLAAVALAPKDAELLYALGLVHARRGEKAEAVASIRKACARSPLDERICGGYDEAVRDLEGRPQKAVDPAKPAPTSTPKGASLAKLELLVEETIARIDDLESLGIEHSKRVEVLFQYAESYLIDPEHFTGTVQTFRERCEEERRRLREELADFRKHKATLPKAAFIDTWNGVVLSSIVAYSSVLSEYEPIRLIGLSVELVAEASRSTVPRLMTSWHLVVTSGYHALGGRGFAEHLVDEQSHGFARGWKIAREIYDAEVQRCHGVDRNAQDACYKAAARAFCQAMTPLYARGAPRVRSRYETTVDGIDDVIETEVSATIARLDDATNFIERATAISLTAKKNDPPAKAVKETATSAFEVVRNVGLLRAIALEQTLSGVVDARVALEGALEEASQILQECEKQQNPKLKTVDEELAALVEALKTGSVGAGPAFDCEGQLGPVTASVEFLSNGVQVSAGLGPNIGFEAGVTYEHDGTWRPRIELSAGKTGSPNIQPWKDPPLDKSFPHRPEWDQPAGLDAGGGTGISAKIEGTAVFEPRPDGKWDVRVGLEGAVGLGYGGKVKGVGYGVACYFFKVNADVGVRTFWETYSAARKR